MLISILLLFLAALMQATLLANFRLFYAVPDLLLIMVIFYSLIKGKKAGIFFGVLAGFIKDILSGSIFGINLFSFALFGYFLGNQSKRLYIENKITHITLTVLCTLANACLNFMYLTRHITFFQYFFTFTLPYILYTTLLAALLSRLFFRLFRY